RPLEGDIGGRPGELVRTLVERALLRSRGGGTSVELGTELRPLCAHGCCFLLEARRRGAERRLERTQPVFAGVQLGASLLDRLPLRLDRGAGQLECLFRVAERQALRLEICTRVLDSITLRVDRCPLVLELSAVGDGLR